MDKWCGEIKLAYEFSKMMEIGSLSLGELWRLVIW